MMKPIKLIISAFGPYSKEMPEINFEQFEEKGLFLISGDTGAGKTTIFDAICFALYGTTSGVYRDTKNLRSEYADANVESFVDFYFSHQGCNYHVLRQPAYERSKQRGKGTITEKEKAVLYIEGKAPVEGLTQVNNAIKELLHIDEKQFKQIAMIAQGEFWDLLNAKTEQRTEILRTIFMTGGYKNIEYKLKDRMDNSNGKRLRTEQSIILYFNDVKADEGDELFNELEDLKEKANRSNSAWNIDELLSTLDSLINADNEKSVYVKEDLVKADEELNRYKEALALAKTNNSILMRLSALEEEHLKLEEQSGEIANLEELLKRQKIATYEVNPSYVSRDAKAKEVSDTESKIDEKKNRITIAKKEAKEADDNLISANKRKPELDILKSQINKITEEESKYQQRDELSKKRISLQNDSKKLADQEVDINRKEEELKNKIKSLKMTIEELKEKPDNLSNVLSETKELTRLYEAANDIISNRIKERNKRIDDLTNKQEAFKVAFEAYENAVNERVEAEKIIECSRAGILAKGLKEGDKCPVCGSTHHPELACISTSSITEEDFEKIKNKEELLQKDKSKANTEAEVAKNAVLEYEDQLRITIIDCMEDSILDVQTDGKNLEELIGLIKDAEVILKDRIKSNTESETKLKKECELLEKARLDYDTAIEKETIEIEKEKEVLAQKKNDNKTSLTECETRLKTLEDLSYLDWNTAISEKKNAEKKLQEITELIDDATDRKTQADKELTATEAELNTLRSGLDIQKKDEVNLKELLNKKLLDYNFDSVDEMLSYVSSDEELEKTEKTINEFKQAKALNKSQLSQAKEDAKGKKIVDIEKQKNDCQKQAMIVDSIRKKENDILNRIKNNKDKQEKIFALKEDFLLSQKEYSVYKRLYDLVRGTTGNGKITLEQYIQAAGFDGIIAAANRRLKPMSDNQYELYRQEDSLGKKSNNFLDLEVLDNYTGHRRPVGNLSGGESFKASLSLALGLSDTVSSNLGGVQMDALFIDEGFGTLDRKSIDSAMDILINLSGSNKLVGVISHREELIENIPQQIRVSKTKDGSHIEIDTGI